MRVDVCFLRRYVTGLDPELIKENIERARARRDAALTEYEAAKSELAWWLEGLKLADPGTASDFAQAHATTELFPDPLIFETGGQPTLRQAIVLTMQMHPAINEWPINVLVARLHDRGWLPDSDVATKRVSDMAGVMQKDGQLERTNRGVYRLAPPLAASLDAKRRTTDYREAARLGFPVPEQRPDSDP
jgi:hypothetical protein